jgi:hypothetical protein
MSSSDYYWTRHLIQGFGRMWFLIVPQEADSVGGGESLLGSVVNEIGGSLFPGGGGIFGKDYPEPHHLTTPRLILKTIEAHRQDLGIADGELIVQEVQYPGLSISVDKRRVLKAGVGGFPSLPAALSVDYSRMINISVEFGANTRKKYIPTGYLSSLKHFLNGDDRKIATNINIDKETIIHQILLTDEYSVTFESTSAFDTNFEAALEQVNRLSGGKISFDLDISTKRRVVVKVEGDRDYLIALKDIDWDDF